MTSVEASTGRRCHDVVNPLHACVYFAPEQEDELAALGLERGPMAYLAGRAAPLGAVGPGTVTATFYNFNHEHWGCSGRERGRAQPDGVFAPPAWRARKAERAK